MVKISVTVNADYMADGRLMPRFVTYEDGIRRRVERVIDVRQEASLKEGGDGQRYLCLIGGRRLYLFFEDGRWYACSELTS